MISSATSYYHELHNSTADFKQHFKKRPFDQNAFEETAEQIHNAYKKIKTTSSSVNSLSSQHTTNPTKTSFAVPSHYSFCVDTNYLSPSGLSKYIDLRDYENDIETNLISDIPRIIDLSTGESLESIPSVEQLEKSRKSKRPIELVENKDELSSILGTMEENKEDLIDENSLYSHKRIRTSKEHMCNFIEEEEEIDPRVYGPAIMKELRIGSKANSVATENYQPYQYLSLYVHGKDSSNIKFTVPYQEAIARYMRSQFQHLNNNEEYKNEGKKLILYRPRNDDFEYSFVNSSGKIFEILEETMDLDQNGAISCIIDSQDQMDID